MVIYYSIVLFAGIFSLADWKLKDRAARKNRLRTRQVMRENGIGVL